MADRSADVVVLGAGPAGLAAALFAARRGLSVTVVEKQTHVGGLAAGIEIGGQRVDLGSHRLHPSIEPSLLAELRSLLGSELQTRPRRGRIRLGERWLAFPLQPADLLRHAPPRLAAGAMWDLAAGPWRRRHPAGPDDATFAATVRRHLGPTIASRFYEPYSRKLFGLAATDLSAELFARRVGVRSGAGLVRRILRGASPSSRTFLYPAGGFGRICEVLADAAIAAGAEIVLGAAATRVDMADSNVAITVEDGHPPIRAATLISTIPGPRLLAALQPIPPADVLAAAGALTFRAGVLVYLVVDTDRYTPFDAHYFPESSVPIARLSEPKNYRDGPDPHGRTVLCAEWPATAGDAVWSSSDADLSAAVVEALVQSGLPSPRLVEVAVRRVPHVYPVYALGHQAHQDTVERWLDSQPRVLATGRQALFAHDNTHHGLEMGRAAAAAVLPDDHAGVAVNRRAWAAARERFRTHVVED